MAPIPLKGIQSLNGVFSVIRKHLSREIRDGETFEKPSQYITACGIEVVESLKEGSFTDNPIANFHYTSFLEVEDFRPMFQSHIANALTRMRGWLR